MAETSAAVFDYFYHYDSAGANIADNKMAIGVPSAGTYWMCLTNLAVTYGQNAVPDAQSGFLVIEGTEENQTSGVCSVGYKTSKLYFPLTPPNSTTPISKTYNRILLRSSDTISLVCHNHLWTKLETTRIVATVHISNDPQVIRSAVGL